MTTWLFIGIGAAALEAAIAAVSKYGGACAGYRTLLDALIPAASVLKEVTVIVTCLPLSIAIFNVFFSLAIDI